MAIFYFIDLIVAAETIEGGRLFKGENYLQKYGRFLANINVFEENYFLLESSNTFQLEAHALVGDF